MRQTVVSLTVVLSMIAALPAGYADTSEYRDVPLAPVPPVASAPALPPIPPIPGAPPTAPAQPCTVDPDNLILNCSSLVAWRGEVQSWGAAYEDALGNWADVTADWPMNVLSPWATGYGGQATAWSSAATAWATVQIPTAAGRVAVDEFTFVGPGGSTTATIHVHDDLNALDSSVVFVVKGGPNGERWLCKHTCSVPDIGFVVSIDPLDVPPNVWAGVDFPLPAVPATSGTITVTFA